MKNSHETQVKTSSQQVIATQKLTDAQLWPVVKQLRDQGITPAKCAKSLAKQGYFMHSGRSIIGTDISRISLSYGGPEYRIKAFTSYKQPSRSSPRRKPKQLQVTAEVATTPANPVTELLLTIANAKINPQLKQRLITILIER